MAKAISTSLQSLKGIAAVTVFLGHALGMYQNEICLAIKQSPFAIFQDGQCAVTLFFMLTGFFCWRETSFTWQQYGKSIWNKAVRIYPAYVLVMIAGWMLANMQLQWDKSLYTEWCNVVWAEPVPLLYLLKSCTLLLPFSTSIVNPPIWYLYVDMRMAFVLPILYFIIRKTSIWTFFILIPTLFFFGKGSMLQYLPYYLGGAILRYVFIHRHNYIDYLVKGKRKWLLLVVGIAALDIFRLANTNYLDAPLLVKLIQVIGAALIVCVIYECNFGCMNRKVMIFLGDISYEFYIVHFIVMLALRPLSLSISLYIAFSFVLSIILAWLLNRYINQPMKKILKS